MVGLVQLTCAFGVNLLFGALPKYFDFFAAGRVPCLRLNGTFA